MDKRDIERHLSALERDPSLAEESDFRGRARVLESLEAQVEDPIASLLDRLDAPAGLERVRSRGEVLRSRLEAADERLFRRLREEIRKRGGAAFRDMLAVHAGPEVLAAARRGGIGYDTLDAFLNGLLHARPLPAETRPPEPGMVFFQKTPGRILLDLAERAGLAPDDVFIDVGAGLGQAVLVIHLLTGAAARGIEVEPAYVDYAAACARDLGLSRVEFLPADAREAEYAQATVVFLYTPCEGAMLVDVLARLRAQVRRGTRLFTYGPCTLEADRQEWLVRLDPGTGSGVDRLAAFAAR